MGRYSEAVAKLKECEEAYYQTEIEIGSLTDDEYEAFKDLLRIAKQIHDKSRSKGGVRMVLKSFDEFRRGRLAGAETSDEVGEAEV